MADSVFERHLQNVTNRIKKRKYDDSDYQKPKAAKINADDDLKILDRELLVVDDDFSCFTDEHRRDELVFDEGNDTSRSQEGSTVPTKVIKLGHDLHNKTLSSSSEPTNVLKCGQEFDNIITTTCSSPVPTMGFKVDPNLDNKISTSSSVPNKTVTLGSEIGLKDRICNNSSVQMEIKPDNVENHVLNSDSIRLEVERSHFTLSPKHAKLSSKTNDAQHSLYNSLLNSENMLKSEITPRTMHENVNWSSSTLVNNTSVTSLKRKPESGLDQLFDQTDSTSTDTAASQTAIESTPKVESEINNDSQKPSKCSENVTLVLSRNKVKSKSAQVVLSVCQTNEESSTDIITKKDRVSPIKKGSENKPPSSTQMKKTGAVSILKGWPDGVEVDDLLVMVMSGDKRIRTVQKVTPNLIDPQLFVRVTSCVSNSPLKVIVMGLKRCVNLNREFYKVTAIGQTEIEKGKKTERIMLSEANGTDCSISLLFSTDKFPNIKHAAVNHTPESNYDIYIQNLIRTHLDYKSRYILLQNIKTGVIYLFIEDYQSMIDVKFVFPFPLRPCTPYKIMIWLADRHANKTLQAFCKIKESLDEGYTQSDNIQIITSVKDLQTYMTKLELKKLADLATAYLTSSSYNQFAYLHCFYRNKPESYFQAIYNRDSGVMLPYMKDQNGDPSSVINDFYCHYDVHYVTVVLTEPGSATDQFCRERLLLLNKYNNPFIKLVNINGESKVYVTLGVHVEVFYTEPVDLYFVFNRQMGFLFEDTPTRGRGCSIPKIGIPKRSDCKICNL